jgi:N-acetylglucosaminyldiphosphoundecaprenol N-acetyl-beta-D-mannosaminyltransferase
MIQKKVSVIIPSYNSAATIRHTIDNLKMQSAENMILEVIIVDSSDDNTKDEIHKRAYDKLKIIGSGRKVIPALSRNIGAKDAKGQILAFIDADAYPDNRWVENIIAAYDNGHRVGGGSIKVADMQKQNPIVTAQYYLQFSEYLPAGKKRIKSFTPSCNMFCDKELFTNIGGFLPIRAAEDLLFGLKISQRERVWFIPDIQVYHIFRNSWQEFFKNQLLLGRFIGVYRKAFGPSFLYNSITPALFALFFILAKFARIVSRVIAAGSRHTLCLFSAFGTFALGVLFWNLGFVKGLLSKKVKIDIFDKVDICGIDIDRVSLDESVSRIEQMIQKHEKSSIVVTANVDHIIKLQRDPLFRDIYRSSDLAVADGVPLLWAAEFLGTPLKGRVNGTDLFERLAGLSAKKGYRLFFLGGRPGAAQMAQAALEQRYQSIKIAGVYSPPFGFESIEEENKKIISMVKKANPDILFVGLGAPKQEKWIYSHGNECNASVSIGIGVSFELVSGIVRRAPVWMQNAGLEWFWRVMMEPKRLLKRYLIDDIKFFWLVLLQKIGFVRSSMGGR